MYPSLSEYIDSVKYASDNLAKLNHLSPVLNGSGEPYYSQGNYAVVFKMQDPSGNYYALKCFTQEVSLREERYKLIANQLQFENSPYLVNIQYLEKEIFVSSNYTTEEEFPVLLMDWVDGEPLDAYIRKNINDKSVLSRLSYRFGEFAQWMLSKPFAHGDLKPDNILVRQDGSLVAIDYDGMYVPAMAGQKAEENGTPDFRHPRRTIDMFDEHIDDFTLATMALALEAIAEQPSLMNEFSPKDRLLFSESDFLDLSTSKLLQRILGMLKTINLQNLWTLFFESYIKMYIPAVMRDQFRLSLPDGTNLTPIGVGGPPIPQPPVPSSKKDELSFTVNGVTFKMKLVEHGTFIMGATPEMTNPYDNEKPAHEVTLTKDYYMGETQVTQALWQAVMGSNPSWFKGDNNPVECVSWNDCQSFIVKLNELTDKSFRLPTEAEWEYAARGGNKSRHTQCAGSANIDVVAWYGRFFRGQTHPVAQKQANELGLYDMSGNVWEWCNDWYDKNYYAKSPQKDPQGPSSGSDRVLRGGSCFDGARRCRLSYRSWDYPGFRLNGYGLRLVL